MIFFDKFIPVIKSYDYRDKLFSVLALALFFMMLAKMILFPYGLFGFGESDMYTEGIVSRAGIQNLNPLFVDYNEADREVSALIFSGLMKYDPETKTIVEDVARLSISEDKRIYTFKLREGIRWHDGKPLTIDDVYFTYKEIIKDAAFQNEILKTNFAGVHIELVDESTIRFTLEKPNVFFVSNFTVGLLPKHILGDVFAEDLLTHEFNKNPVGTGPYTVRDPVESFPDGRTQIVIERNSDYYGERPGIEVMRFIAYPAMDDLVDRVHSLNGVVKVSGRHIPYFMESDRFDLIPYELPQYTAVFMNMESEVLKDNHRVRLALQKAVDKDMLIGESVDKIRVDTPLMELDQEDWVYQADFDQAQGALKDAGYSYAEDDLEHEGLRYDSKGDPLSLRFIARLHDEGTYQYEETMEIVNFLVDSWGSIGVDVNVEFFNQEEFNLRIMSRNYDLLLVGQILGYNLDTYSYWHSTQAGPRGQNFSNYKSFQVDSLIESIRSTFDVEEKERRLEQLGKVLREEVPAVFLYRPVYYYATDGKVSGIDMDGVVFSSDRFARISSWGLTR